MPRLVAALAGLALAACTPGRVSGTTGSTGSASTGSTGSASGAGSTGSTSSGSTGTSAGASTGTSSAGSSSTGTSGSTGGALGPEVDALVGVNAFVDDPLDKLAAFGTVREYHDWVWDDGNGVAGYPGYPNNQLEFSLWGGFWDFDHFYGALRDQGQLAFPAVQGSVDYLGNAMPPVPSGASTTDPASYAAHADFMYQLAARYGAARVPDAQLKLKAGQVRTSGLGALRWLEDGNEPDNNWTLPGGAQIFTAEVYAAMASADYDGDQGRLGPTFGVKQADPTMKMLMAGLAGTGRSTFVESVTAYLDGMRAWADQHRGGSFPADAINIHHYCFGPDPFGTANPRPGISPEACNLADTLRAVVTYRDAHLPGKEVWLTEFGYDTDPGSNLRAPAIGSTPGTVVQGQWLVRSFLALAEAGVDRATLFVLRDGCSSPTCQGHDIQFTTSGVLTEKGQWQPKPAFFFVAAFRHQLTGMRFAGSRASGDAGVRIDTFRAPSGAGAYVLWSPTSDGSARPGYALAVPGAASATRVTLADGQVNGVESALSITGGSVSVDVGETPVIVKVDRLP